MESRIGIVQMVTLWLSFYIHGYPNMSKKESYGVLSQLIRDMVMSRGLGDVYKRQSLRDTSVWGHNLERHFGVGTQP